MEGELIALIVLADHSWWTAGRISTVNPVKGASPIIRKKSKEEEEVKEVESVDEQLKKMETAANANRSEWEAQLKAKLGNLKTGYGCWGILSVTATERKTSSWEGFTATVDQMHCYYSHYLQ